ncbi:hypothetical protein TWF730_010766 [Orbilia blumenaviensis]|uniref:Uncharacterized protein n=1 Tax=Orbilia blumenaviensis TaxID=1796055 RepID=A0AAV9UQ04_9PEZI
MQPRTALAWRHEVQSNTSPNPTDYRAARLFRGLRNSGQAELRRKWAKSIRLIPPSGQKPCNVRMYRTLHTRRRMTSLVQILSHPFPGLLPMTTIDPSAIIS